MDQWYWRNEKLRLIEFTLIEKLKSSNTVLDSPQISDLCPKTELSFFQREVLRREALKKTVLSFMLKCTCNSQLPARVPTISKAYTGEQ